MSAPLSPGLAGVEGICIAIAGYIYMNWQGEAGLALVNLVISATCFGFLFWNWPPARLFMGDVGSCTLGYFFGVMSFYAYLNETMSVVI